jgi:cytoplasmic iron level regulating protein YaaA (DUF328/UPF0246 family)
MKILISPAKSINEDVQFPDFNYSLPLFGKEAKSLVLKLKKKKANHLMDMMHVSKDIAELNVNRFKNWHLSDVPSEHVKPAAFLFTGEVYRGLAMNELSDEVLLKAQDSLRVLSGLYGMLKPFDLIYPYRLEMGTKWSVSDKAANLYQFWGMKVLKALEKQTDKSEVIVNLASTEYAKVIPFKQLKRTVITPVFKEFKGGEYKIVMMYAKNARGKMARFILENDFTSPEELKLFQADGYQFNEALSDATNWVFVR